VALCVLLGGAAAFLPAAGPVTAGTGAHLPPVLPIGAGLAFLALLLASPRAAVPGRLAAGVLALAGMGLAHGLARAVLLEASAVVALLLMRRSSAARTYFAAVALSALGTIGGAYAVEAGHWRLALSLLLPGIAIKLALVPLSLWLPDVAEAVPAALAGLVIGVVDVAAFAEVWLLRAEAPGLFAPAWPWLALGLGSTLAGALLALGTRNLKRLLAFSTIADMGMLTMALVLGGTWGLEGAALGAGVHALAKALLFASVSAPDADGGSLEDPRGLAARHPLPAAGFLVGAFAVVGVPPTLGFLAHWRLFSALAPQPWLFVPMLGAAMLLVATYARAIAVFWWGGDATAPAERTGPALAAAILLLCCVLVTAGLLGRLA
jgi:formate hydrogenlyase subunit 3/multisubunit Na+/H+ antiporter MnhD subunit